MKNLIIKCCYGLIGLLTIASCKKFVDVGQPKNQLTATEVFADSTDANAAVLGVYISMMESSLGLCSGGLTLYPALSADELYQTANNTTYGQFYADAVQSNNNINNGLWAGGYNFIYSVNACMEGVNASADISSASKKQLIAEARFIRGMVNFDLLNLYGGIPLITSTDYKVNSVTARSNTDQVYAAIITDLQAAESDLGTNSGSNDRPSSLAASALLAKVYLYKQSYALAESEASKVINSGVYSLEPDLNNVFLSGSNETIWQLDLPYLKYTWEGQNFVPSSASALPKYVLTSNLFTAFESGDQRLIDWVKVNTVKGTAYPFPYKYKNNGAATVATESYVVLRLADQYLIRSEAEANQNDIVDAANDLDIIRNRAGLAGTTAADKSSLISAIFNERRVEFFCEWGNRWFDLKRSGQSTAVLSPLKMGWNANDVLYPIPQAQLTADPHLVQNPGY